MAGEIISERRATSNRNGGRHHPGFAGDFPRNQQAKFPPSTIYANAVAKIGEFGDCAATVVRFFASIAAAREAAERLRGHPLADNLPTSEVARAADGLIGIAKMGSDLFPFLKTGIESEDGADGD